MENKIQEYYLRAFATQQEREVNKFTEIIRNYQMLTTDYQKTMKELERLETENTQLRASKGGATLLKAQEKEIKNLRSQTEYLEDQLDEKEQIVKLTMDNVKLVKQVAKLEKKMENRDKEFNQLEEVLQIKSQQLSEKRKQAEQAEQENAKFKDRKDHMEKKIQKLTNENADLINRIIVMKQEVVNKMNEANELYDEALNFRKTSLAAFEENKSHMSLKVEDEPGSMEDLNLNYFFKTSTSGLLPLNSKSFISAHQGAINCVAFYPNGPFVMTGGAQKVVKVWSTDTNVSSEKKSLKGMIQPITSVSTTLDGARSLVTSTEKQAKIFNMKTCRALETLSGHVDLIHEGKICNTKPYGATGSGDRTVRIWDISKGVCKRSLQALSSCNAIDIDCCDSMVAAGHLNGGVTIWQLDTGEKITELKGVHDEPLTSVRFSYDRNYLLTNSRDNTMKLIDLRRDKNMIEMKDPLFTNGFIYNRATISANDKYGVVGSSQGHILFFSLLDGKLQEVIENAHQCRIQSVQWQPRETTMASVDQYGGLVVWGD